MSRFTRRFGYLVRPTSYPNVWRLADGRFLIRARTKDNSGKLREVRRVLECSAAREASQKAVGEIRSAASVKKASEGMYTRANVRLAATSRRGIENG